jgi:hypothetical protein
VGDLAVKERHRIAGRSFQVFGESAHRTISDFLAAIETPDNPRPLLPNAATKQLRDEHRGIVLLYPVREEQKDKVSIGFELLFPKNNLAFEINFTVRRRAESSRIVVQAPRT